MNTLQKLYSCKSSEVHGDFLKFKKLKLRLFGLNIVLQILQKQLCKKIYINCSVWFGWKKCENSVSHNILLLHVPPGIREKRTYFAFNFAFKSGRKGKI